MKTLKEHLYINESLGMMTDTDPKIIVISNTLYGKTNKPDVSWYKNEKQLINEYSKEFIDNVKLMKAGEFKQIKAAGFDGFVGKIK